jgi:thiaminase/transcriptional activator TenA
MKPLFFTLLAFSFFSSQTQVLGHQEDLSVDFFDVTFKSCQKILNQTKEMPFVQELVKGHLSEERFSYYIAQDMPYLDRLAQQRATLATQLQELQLTECSNVVAKKAKGLKAFAEKKTEDVFQGYCKGVFKNQTGVIPCLNAYLQHQTDSLNKGPACGAAALNPCPVVYYWLAKELQHLSPAGNKYQQWVDSYSKDEYGEGVAFWKNLYNTLAEKTSIAGRVSMKKAFQQSVKHEYDFFDQSYHKVDVTGSSKCIRIGSKETKGE